MNNLVKKAQLVEINGQDMTTDGHFTRICWPTSSSKGMSTRTGGANG